MHKFVVKMIHPFVQIIIVITRYSGENFSDFWIKYNFRDFEPRKRFRDFD